MFRRLIANIEKQEVSISLWLKGLVGIIFIRCLLEAFLFSPTYTATDIFIALDPLTLIHYILFFFAAILGLTVIIYLFTKHQPVYKIIFFSGILIWFAPLFDTVSTGGNGSLMMYYFNNNLKLLSELFSFYSPHFTQGITLGIRVEVTIMLIGVGILVWLLKKNVKTVVLTVITSFVFLFGVLSLPGLVYTISHPTFSTTTDAQTRTFMINSVLDSNLKFNTIQGNLMPKNVYGLIELGFDKLITQLNYLLLIIFLGIWFFVTQKDKFIAVIKNSRFERVGLYLTLLFIGMIYSIKLGLGGIYNWVDIMSVIILAISWYSAWMFAVHTNDITDVKTDSVSNPSRPITSKKLDVIEMREISYIWLVLSLFGSFSVGYCTFFLNLVFTAAYYIYSVPPLRLKRVPILSSFLISIACLSTVLAGFFFLSISKVAITFPVMFAVGIVTIFTLAVNIRDLKDVAGDKTEGINTLPVLFEKNGRKIVGILFSLAFLLVPIFLSFYALYLIAIPASIVGYILVMRDPYQEKYIFDLFFVFLVLLVISYFVL